jgi:probable rRNA maturation factor
MRANPIDIEVEAPQWTGIKDTDDIARKAALIAAALGPPGAINILLTDDAAVRDLNVRFRGIDAPTNVLAFPAGPHAPGELGDLALAFEVCSREAAEQNKPLADHLRHLVIHGVLHLIGYDHQGADDARLMETLERRLLASLGVDDPYIRRDDVQPAR